jgi:hypothetical protein
MNQLLRTKSIDALIAASEEPDRRLKKSLGVWSLIALGVGAVIGSGIFTVTGTAAAGEHFLAKSIFKAPVFDLLLNGGNCNYAQRPAGRGSGHLGVFRIGGHRLRIRRHLLRRAGLHDPHRRQRVHLFLRHAGRNLRLDHRLGSDPGIRVLQHERGGGILGLFERPARQPVPLPSADAALAAHV